MNKIMRFILLFLVVVWAGNKLFLVYINKTYSEKEVAQLFDSITTKYGIEIVYKVGESFFSPLENPPIPAGPGRNSKITPIRHRVLAHYPTILHKAFEKYPVGVITEYLKGVYFAAEINEDGLKYGGTYDPYRRIIYIVDNGNQEDHSIYAIHHELSSLMMARHSFFINPWTDNNPKDFNYLLDSNDNVLEVYRNISLTGTDVDYENGFVTDYGKINLENDFNEYSAMIFTYPDKFKKIMQQYPRVRGKFLVWLKFYQKIDPVFTEAYLLGSN